ncbi:MAG: OmpA family protein [Crocinitomicaceae bacterium]|nr:OmpA family protein [Crocinitomicaceae bacterium]
MKFNLYLLTAFTLLLSIPLVNAQKKGKRGKSISSDILNMTFEKLQDDESVTELGAISILENGVSSPTENAADLFQKGAGNEFGVPNNVFGNEMTAENGGSLYAGFVAYRPGRESSLRSYITIPFLKGKANESLRKDRMYCIQFDVSLAESSKFACNNVGAYLTKEAPSTPSGIINASENIIRGKHNRIHQGFFGWDKVCQIYTAKGDEKFITIGNFDANSATKYITVKKPKSSDVEALKHAYYYVDNVTVKLIDSEEECQCIATNQMANVEEYSTLVYAKAANIDETMSLSDKISANVAYFGFGKKDFTAGSKEALKFIAAQLKANPELSLVITGHADAQEEELGINKNEFKDMGMVRAKYAERYFMAQGIDLSRLTIKSMGAEMSSREIADVDEDELKAAKNRRVEFSLD